MLKNMNSLKRIITVVLCPVVLFSALSVFAQSGLSLPELDQSENIRTDTLFPQLVVEPDSFFVVIKPDTSLIKHILLSNEGNDTLFYSIDTRPEPWKNLHNVQENISGSTLTTSKLGYVPGETFDFTFSLYNGSNNNEWLDTLIVNFPQGVTLNFATNFVGGSLGPLVYNGTSGNGVTVGWNDTNGGIGGNILPGETATSIVNLTFSESLNDTLEIVYTISGDVNGAGPHEITDTLLLFPEEIWLIAEPDAGMILPGQQKNIDLIFNSEGLPIANYYRYFTIHSNDTTNPDLDIPVRMIVFPYNLTQTISIPEGWSGISSYVIPLNPAFETIFDTVKDKLDVLFNVRSQLYWPDENINTIGNWDTFDGYIVKAKEPLQIKVYGLFEISQTVLLFEGWNFIPVLNSVPSSSFVIFRDIDEKLDIVREVGGNKVYWPEQSIYTLTHLLPGHAYFVRVKEDCHFVFPPPVK